MKAIRIHEHGDVSVLRIDEIDEPQPRANEVLLEVRASSLNHMDIWVREGMPGIGELPLTLGCDASGVIAAVGSGVTELQKGDRVFVVPLKACGICTDCLAGRLNYCRKMQIWGEHLNGTHAQKICLPKQSVMKLADNLGFEEGAAFPLVFLTAWHMLVTNAQVKSGQTVLVMGATSGVGHAAIQIAKSFGAEVIATAGSSEKLAQAQELGADHVINHYETSIATAVKDITNKRGVDIIIEHVGQKVWQECLKSLARGGMLVTCGATTGPMVTTDLRHLFIKQQKIVGSTMGRPIELIEIHKLIACGKLKPKISKVYPYQDVKKAHRDLENSQHFGKIILQW